MEVAKMNVECPKCGYKSAVQSIRYFSERIKWNKQNLFKEVSWFCPKCDFSKKRKLECDAYEFQWGRFKKQEQPQEAEIEVNLKAKGKK